MKTVAQALADLDRKLAARWHVWLTAADCRSDPGAGKPDPVEAATFPLVVPLGRISSVELTGTFTQVNREALAWQQYAVEHDVEVRWENRLVRGSTQQLATHLVVTDLTCAARLAGGSWPTRLAGAIERLATLRSLFGQVPAWVLRDGSRLADVDFEMLCTASLWLRDNDPTGLTARQLPIEGVHGKWPNQHRKLLLALSGRDTLGLVERASQVRYTYLDPDHRLAGLRWHDSHTLGDSSTPLYPPTLAVISENKDTAQLFKPLAGAISIHGHGDAAVAQLPAIPWLATIPALFYWGDIDAEGYEALDGLRAAGLPVQSLLMDMDAYTTFERYGSTTDAAGKPLAAVAARALVHLTHAERQVYERLVDPAWTRVRRIEQERIPLSHAAEALRRLLARSADTPAEDGGPLVARVGQASGGSGALRQIQDDAVG